MAVFIKGMAMPKSCLDCDINVEDAYGNNCCAIIQECTSSNITTRLDDCPLCEVIIGIDLIKELYFEKKRGED